MRYTISVDNTDKNLDKFEGSVSFENRKKDHIYWSLSKESQVDLSPSSQVRLSHNPLPEINLSDVILKSDSNLFLNKKPLLISSMTGGHTGSVDVNLKLSSLADKNDWLFSTGSLRREVEDGDFKTSEWARIREEYKNLSLIGNIGLPQILDKNLRKKLITYLNELNFNAIFVHLNPLQEALQKEGTPFYKDGIKAIKELKSEISIPVLLKETGTGFSKTAAEKIKDLDVAAIDVSGFGGTHWGRIEGLRTDTGSLAYKTAQTFKDWGHSTVESLLNLSGSNAEVWASGGLRTGLDAAVCFALGARVSGFAMPFLKVAMSEDESDMQKLIDQIENELKIALFCTGSESISDLRSQGGWSWK